ncbi:MAG TPA: hypothetical protein VMY34_09460, partial [Acidimicrobiales bacterium]|nr:hypothetical protein [Acidimicrobiales bacterium]
SFVIGGASAATSASAAPLKHAAVSGAVAFGMALVGGLVRNAVTGRSLGFAGLVTALLLWQIATSLSLLGGALGSRRRRRAGATA